MASLLVASAAAQSASTEPSAAPSAAPSGGGYYIEFRVAEIGAYGHSYAVYGAVGGKPQYADLHPVGGYGVMAIGHVLPVPANTTWNPAVLSLPVASRYRKSLNAAQYQRLLAAVRSAKASGQYWNAVSNNCNHFIGKLAAAVGLKVPAQFQLSYAFVPDLRAINEGSAPRAAPTRKRAPAGQARTGQAPPS